MLYICLAFSNCWILFYMPHVSPRGRTNPVKIKCNHTKTIITTTFMKWPAAGSGGRGTQQTHPPYASLHNSHHSPMFPFPFPATPPLSQCQGQGSRAAEHLGAANWQLSWSHVVKSPKALAWQLLSEELMNDKWWEPNHSYSSVHSYLSNDVRASQKFWKLQATWEDI